MRIFGKIMMVCLFLSSFSLAGFSQMYRWRDKDGNLVISTNPPPPGVKWEKKTTEPPSQGGPKTKDADGVKRGVQEVDLKRSNRDIKVTMYMTTWCPVCKKARDYLNSLGVNLTEFDIEKDPEKEKEWLRKVDGRKGVPVIDVEGIIMQGLNSEKITAALEERKRIGVQY
jgi:glutaredoxin